MDGSLTQRATGGETDAEPIKAVRCVACRHALTDQASACAVDGAHAHTFVNPWGFVFDIRCYARAPGVAVTGPAEAATSWFPETAWRAAVCGGCDAHVGWSYEGRLIFVALIADRIAIE